MTLVAEVAQMLADDFWLDHGLIEDITQGVTREDIAKSKLRLAERIVEHVLAQRPMVIPLEALMSAVNRGTGAA